MNYFALFGAADMPRWLVPFTDPTVILALALPVIAVVVGIVWITALIPRHKERIAKIQHGIDPDANPGGNMFDQAFGMSEPRSKKPT